MIDRLFDLISSWLGALKFWSVVNADERGLLLRWGKFRRELEPGARLIWPIADTVRLCKIVQGTMRLFEQGLITKDQKDVTVSAILTFKVVDPKLFLLETDGGSALDDVSYGEISDWICSHDLDYVRDPDNWREIQSKIRRAAEAYGIKVVRMRFGDFCRSKAIRLLGQHAA